MLKIENTEVLGWEHAIRGMRNPMNSWEKSDSDFTFLSPDGDPAIGPNDHDLMMRLARGGPVHAKYRRMIAVYVTITAPLYWWKEFDTYKVGTVANSCSTMHKIAAKEFTLEDFSHEHLIQEHDFDLSYTDEETNELRHCGVCIGPDNILNLIINILNFYRNKYLETKDKEYWWQMIQLLPNSYNQKRTIMMNYEVLANIYKSRKNHKLDEWRTFCSWIEELPYSEIIVGKLEDLS